MWGHFRSAARASSTSKSLEKTFREKTLGLWFFAFTFPRWGHRTDLLPGCVIPAITLKAQQTLPLFQQQQASMRKGGRCGACLLGTHDILWSCVFVYVSVWLCGVCIPMFVEVRGHPGVSLLRCHPPLWFFRPEHLPLIILPVVFLPLSTHICFLGSAISGTTFLAHKSTIIACQIDAQQGGVQGQNSR